MKIITFDIKTSPDLEAGRRLYGKPEDMAQLGDEDVSRVMTLARWRESDGHSEQLHPPLQRIAAIAVAVYDGQQVSVEALGDSASSEVELLHAFFALSPGQYVLWDAAMLAVLHYRSLFHACVAPAYWQTPPLSLQAQLSPQPVPMHELVRVLGLPVNPERDAANRWETWVAGNIDAVRAASVADAVLLYRLWLRYRLIRGELSNADYQVMLQQIEEV